jgi:hypothetical protein
MSIAEIFATTDLVTEVECTLSASDSYVETLIIKPIPAQPMPFGIGRYSTTVRRRSSEQPTLPLATFIANLKLFAQEHVFKKYTPHRLE